MLGDADDGDVFDVQVVCIHQTSLRSVYSNLDLLITGVFGSNIWVLCLQHCERTKPVRPLFFARHPHVDRWRIGCSCWHEEGTVAREGVNIKFFSGDGTVKNVPPSEPAVFEVLIVHCALCIVHA